MVLKPRLVCLYQIAPANGPDGEHLQTRVFPSNFAAGGTGYTEDNAVCPPHLSLAQHPAVRVLTCADGLGSRRLIVLPDSRDPLSYENWLKAELLDPEVLAFDTENPVFRQALVHLSCPHEGMPGYRGFRSGYHDETSRL